MKVFKRIGILLLAAFIVIQFFPPARNTGGTAAADLTKTFPVPPRVQEILKASCSDCHSNHTNYPWYARVQPLGWWLSGHIKKGKEALNLNEFGTYSLRRQKSKLKAMENSISEGTMPLRSYTLLHPGARLSAEDKASVISWLVQTKDRVNVRK